MRPFLPNDRELNADRATHDFTLSEPNGDWWPRAVNGNATPESLMLSVWNPWSGELWPLYYDVYPGSWRRAKEGRFDSAFSMRTLRAASSHHS